MIDLIKVNGHATGCVNIQRKSLAADTKKNQCINNFTLAEKILEKLKQAQQLKTKERK